MGRDPGRGGLAIGPDGRLADDGKRLGEVRARWELHLLAVRNFLGERVRERG